MYLFPVNKPNYWSCYVTTIQRGFLVHAAVQAQSKKDLSQLSLQLCYNSSNSSSSPPSATSEPQTHLSRRVLQSACKDPLQRSSLATWGRLQSLHSSGCWQGQLAACCSHSGPGSSPAKAEPLEARLKESTTEDGIRNVTQYSMKNN